jgi:DNA-binding CsgD family transcriptional regulator
MSACLQMPGGADVPVGRSLSIGRAPTNDLVLPDPKVSRRHAVIHEHAGIHWITDFGSRNGTYVGDVPVVDPMPLNKGDRLLIGDSQLRFFTDRPVAAYEQFAGDETVAANADGAGGRPRFAPGIPAVIVLDPALQVAQSNGCAHTMLRRHFNTTSKKRLPSCLRKWLGSQMDHQPAPADPRPYVVETGVRRLTISAFLDNSRQPLLVLHEEEVAFAIERIQALGLSPRESSVMHWVAQGKTNAEIAVILNVSVGTVNKHVESSLRKLHVENRYQAILRLLDHRPSTT